MLGEARPPEDDRGLTLYASAHWRRLLECAMRALDDPLLGLHVGQRITPAHLGALGYALHACRDAGAALARWQQYEHLIANVARMEVRVEATSVAIEWHDAPEPLGPLVDEVALTAIVQFARNITGTHHGPDEVCFVHPSPGDEQPYIDYFGCPVRFGQPVNRLAFPLHLLMQPLRQPDDALLQMMERRASALLAELRQTDDLEQSVREAVARLLTQGEASLEQIAADLHVSSRTLHRRLAELGLNFRILREDTRRRLAIDHLNDPRLTLAEVAWLLGYSEHSVLRAPSGAGPANRRNSGAAGNRRGPRTSRAVERGAQACRRRTRVRPRGRTSIAGESHETRCCYRCPDPAGRLQLAGRRRGAVRQRRARARSSARKNCVPSRDAAPDARSPSKAPPIRVCVSDSNTQLNLPWFLTDVLTAVDTHQSGGDLLRKMRNDF